MMPGFIWIFTAFLILVTIFWALGKLEERIEKLEDKQKGETDG